MNALPLLRLSTFILITAILFWIELIRNNWRGRSNLYDSDLDEVINALNLKRGGLSDFEQKKSDRAGV